MNKNRAIAAVAIAVCLASHQFALAQGQPYGYHPGAMAAMQQAYAQQAAMQQWGQQAAYQPGPGAMPMAADGYDPGYADPGSGPEIAYGDCADGSCGDGSCGDGGCPTGSCSPGHCGCTPWYAHRCRVFGEGLYLAPRGLGVAYAAQVNGPIAPPANQGIQTGPIAATEFDYDIGFRGGGAVALSDCASIVATYTHYETDTSDAIARTGTDDIRSLVTQPLVQNANADWLSASATHDIQFQLADVEYRWLYSYSRRHAVNLSIGARYAHYEQEFRSRFDSNDFRFVNTDIAFDGGGLRLGADFERKAAHSGVFVYGKGYANFLAGNFRSDFTQGSLGDPIEVDTDWETMRVITMLEIELGVGWQSKGGHLRTTAGYFVSGWFNTITTETFIDAVQANEFTDVGAPVAFDGFAGRVEYRF